MASLIPGYEYDIFISYRQKDNKYDGWVTEFVDNLKRELEATFKEDISVYFDINPHDGLLETHDVDASLKEKLKCLIFIPIISRTYCDPKSFAWEHEFIAFVEQASKDRFGLKVKLPNGNVSNRVLPVRIHDLDTNDIQLCESALGGVLRGVEFIYKEPGVNRSLTPKDKEKKNLNGTIYRNQINKVALAIKEIILGMQTGPGPSVKEKAQRRELFGEDDKTKKSKGNKKTVKLNKRKLETGVAILAALIFITVLAWPKIFKRDTLEKLASSGKKISIAVMPFQNMTNDTTFNYWQELIQSNLISSLSNTGELRVRGQDNINTLLQTRSNVELASISQSTAGTVSKKLEADIFINGNIQKAGSMIRISAQLIDTKTTEVLKSFEVNGPYNDSIIIIISDSLRKKVTDFLLISKLIKENLVVQHLAASTNSPEALKNYVYGFNANKKWDFPTAREFYLKALEIDSNYLDPMLMLFDVDQAMGLMEQSLQLLLQMHRKRDQWPPVQQLWADWSYATSFESPDEQIKYMRQLQQIDEQRVDIPLIIGGDYNTKKEYNKAIPELENGLELWQKTGWREYFKGNSAVYVSLGEAYHKTGQYDKEKKLYKIAEPDCPNDLPLILRQTSLSLAEKDTIAANRYIEKFKSVCKANFSSPEVRILDGLGDIYNLAGMKDKADSYYRKELALDTGNTQLMKWIAGYYIENNRNLDEVSELMDKALKRAKNKVDYYNYLDTKGWGLYKQGKIKEALEILQKCWNEAPFKLYSIRSHYEEVKKAVEGQK